jgi:hypothetical protein
VHYDLISAQRDECRSAEGPVWNKYSELFSVLPNQADDAPGHGARTAVAMDEKINTVPGAIPVGLKVVVDDPEGVIGDLKLVARSS